MNLLLLLSALLSALTGAGQVARGSRAPEVVCAAVTARPAGVAVARLAARPAQPTHAPVAVPPAGLADFALLPAEPAYARRRRE